MKIVALVIDLSGSVGSAFTHWAKRAPLLGRTARRTNAFPAPWHNLPLAMGVATPFLMTVVGGVLEAINERLLEVPLVVLAAGWIELGAAIAGQRAAGVAAQGTTYELS